MVKWLWKEEKMSHKRNLQLSLLVQSSRETILQNAFLSNYLENTIYLLFFLWTFTSSQEIKIIFHCSANIIYIYILSYWKILETVWHHTKNQEISEDFFLTALAKSFNLAWIGWNDPVKQISLISLAFYESTCSR